MLFTNHSYFIIQVKNLLTDVSFEVFTYISKDTSATRFFTWILKSEWFVNNMGSHNVRTYWMHHVCIKNWPEDGSLEPKHVANYVLMTTIYVVFWLNKLLCHTDGTGFHTCKECHKTESLWNRTTTDHKEGEKLEDRRSVGASSCNSGDGTDRRVQSLDVYDDDDVCM